MRATFVCCGCRDLLGIHGPKYGCGLNVCKACTSHINGKAFHPCSVPISQIKPSDKIVTIEGLPATVHKPLHPMQQAWIDYDVGQCGYCLPGQIMTAVAMVEELRAKGKEDHRSRARPDPQRLSLRDLRPDPRCDPGRRGAHARAQAEEAQAPTQAPPGQASPSRAQAAQDDEPRGARQGDAVDGRAWRPSGEAHSQHGR